jgi:hypothetical protein
MKKMKASMVFYSNAREKIFKNEKIPIYVRMNFKNAKSESRLGNFREKLRSLFLAV